MSANPVIRCYTEEVAADLIIAETDSFLYRHPWMPSDLDDPIELLRALRARVADLEHELGEVRVKRDCARNELHEAEERNEALISLFNDFKEKLKQLAAT